MTMTMRITKIVVGILAVVIVALLGVLAFVPRANSPTTSEVHAGLEIFVPHANDAVDSPLAVQGQVTGGGWFFEGSFPISVFDADGRVLGTGTAQALSNWMSTGTVPFSASVHFTAPHFASGTVMFKNDNPSGLAQNQKSLSVPIVFKTVDTGGPIQTGTVRGRVVLGPTCPVERVPPDPGCAPRPYQTAVAISFEAPSGEIKQIKTVQTNSSGSFSVAFLPGTYFFQPQGGSVYPRCENSEVVIDAGQVIDVTINCDTGIR